MFFSDIIIFNKDGNNNGKNKNVGHLWEFINSMASFFSSCELKKLTYKLCSAIDQWNSFTQYPEFQLEFPVHIISKTTAIVLVRILLIRGVAVPSHLVVITERIYWELIFPICNYKQSEEEFVNAHQCIEIHKSHAGECICTQCFCHVCSSNFNNTYYPDDNIFTLTQNEDDSDEQLSECHPLSVPGGGGRSEDLYGSRFHEKENDGKSRGELKFQNWLLYRERLRKRTKAQQSRFIRQSRLEGPDNSYN